MIDITKASCYHKFWIYSRDRLGDKWVAEGGGWGGTEGCVDDICFCFTYKNFFFKLVFQKNQIVLLCPAWYINEQNSKRIPWNKVSHLSTICHKIELPG